MKKLENFWNEAKDDVCVMNGVDHQYVIENGCKVEFYDDGSLVIYNTMIGGDFYKVIKGEERNQFFKHGFKLQSLKQYISTATEIKELMIKRAMNVLKQNKKAHTREDAINKLVQNKNRDYADYVRMIEIGKYKLNELLTHEA